MYSQPTYNYSLYIFSFIRVRAQQRGGGPPPPIDAKKQKNEKHIVCAPI